ncbi:hypothetical protein QTO34_013779 [Cnephaeus nilssonii]|uniref:Core shell protein Gag P30 domain-containing protein n=1 Tax=Cnephaeus nilssonii TaxID=3371016 RepID=A0AA40LVE4_CNENI|nr:hypothetical protein QTO34_013779 [Eptesicus nilssonii]
MGNSSSAPTVLECMLRNFKKGFVGDYGVKLFPWKLKRMCEIDWPSFGVGWPPNVHRIITGDPGHPDQFPYIGQWLEIARHRPPWIWLCVCKKGQRTPRGSPASFTTSISASSGTQCSRAWPPPPSISPQPDSPEPVGRHLHTAGQGPRPHPAFQMPLRKTRGLQVLGEDGTLEEGRLVFYYQPFTMIDLLNWKHHTPAYSEKPQAMVDLLESIFQTHKPTWVDCKQLLLTLFNTEERMRIVTEAWKWLQTQAWHRQMAPDTDKWAREALPDEEPRWDPNSEDGRVRLERYRLAFLQGLRAEAKKPTNMAKTSEVFQKPDESPAAFYERLCEAYWVYPPFDPEAPEYQTLVNAAFVGQAQPDIRRKLQKLEGFAGKKHN